MPLTKLERVKLMIAAVGRENPSLRRSLRDDRWGHNGVWMVGRLIGMEEEGLPVRTWTHKYLTAVSLGPWATSLQLHQKNLVLRRVGDAEFSSLDPRTVRSLPFRLEWQRRHTAVFHTNLRRMAWTLDALCVRLRRFTGEGAYSVLATLSGLRTYSKCLDFFVREGLKRDTVPIDRHVERLLERFGLTGVPPPHLAFLIREAGYEPRLVSRVLFQQGLMD